MTPREFRIKHLFDWIQSISRKFCVVRLIAWNVSGWKEAPWLLSPDIFDKVETEIRETRFHLRHTCLRRQTGRMTGLVTGTSDYTYVWCDIATISTYRARSWEKYLFEANGTNHIFYFQYLFLRSLLTNAADDSMSEKLIGDKVRRVLPPQWTFAVLTIMC